MYKRIEKKEEIDIVYFSDGGKKKVETKKLLQINGAFYFIILRCFYGHITFTLEFKLCNGSVPYH